MNFQNFCFYMFVCLVVTFLFWRSIGSIQLRVKRVLLKSLVITFCFSFTIVPVVLIPNYDPPLWVVLSPILFAIICHFVQSPETFDSYAYNWYLFPFLFWLIVNFSLGYFISVIVGLKDIKSKKSERTEWLS